MIRSTERGGRGLMLLAGWALIASGTACEDEGGGGKTTLLPGGDARVIGPGDGSTPLPVERDLGAGAGGAGGEGAGGAGGGGAGGAGGEGGVGGAGGEGGGAGGAGGGAPAECQVPATRCVQDGQRFVQVCRDDGQWSIQPCPVDTVCQGGQCIDDPAGCTPGRRICLGREQPAVCAGDDTWSPTEACRAGDVCADGQCRSLACVQAEQTNSYLGCDYLAADLPNSSFENPGTTRNAAVGIVLANPDLGQPVRVRILDSHGAVAPLVGRQVIELPAHLRGQIPNPGQYPPQTVQTEIRDADGTIVQEGLNQADDVEIPAGGLGTFLVANAGPPSRQTTIVRNTWRIKTDRPVAAYQFSPYCCNFSFSNDASLLIPVSALGLEYRFLGVPSMPSGNNHGPGIIAIIAAEDGTDVAIDVPAGVATAQDGSGGRVRRAGGGLTARLDAQEMLLVQTGAPNPFANTFPDLSGARIRSSAPVATFSAHLCTFYPQLLSACDHVQEQLFPTGTWGQRFVLAPPVRRGQARSMEAVYWKILARDDGATVTLSVPFNQLGAQRPGYAGVPYCGDLLDGPDTIRLGARGYCEFGTMSPVQIEGSVPLMVMGIISGQESTGILTPFGAAAGDPAIFLVPPELQYRNDYVFLVPGTYANDYVTVVADPTASLFLDDVEVSLADATPVPGSELVFKHFPVEEGAHRLASNRPFGILVFAFDDFVSYAFTGGLNLTKR